MHHLIIEFRAKLSAENSSLKPKLPLEPEDFKLNNHSRLFDAEKRDESRIFDDFCLFFI